MTPHLTQVGSLTNQMTQFNQTPEEEKDENEETDESVDESFDYDDDFF